MLDPASQFGILEFARSPDDVLGSECFLSCIDTEFVPDLGDAYTDPRRTGTINEDVNNHSDLALD